MLGLSGCELFEQTPSVYVLSIEKTATEGLVDTYTVYYSDGTTGTFEITNGADGKDGVNGKDGADGKDGVNGKDGADGKDGTSETIVEVNSDNSKTINACLQSVGKVFSAFTEYDESGYGSITEKIVVDTLTDGGIAQTIGLSEGDEVKAIVIDGVSYLLNRYFEIGNYVLALTEGVSFCFEYERNGEKKTTSEYTVSLSDLHFVN